MRMTIAISGFINFLFGLTEGLLGLRVILKLFGANAAAPFVNWIYNSRHRYSHHLRVLSQYQLLKEAL